MATQVLFGAPVRQGRHEFGPGDVFGVLASELTHAGKRVRSWAFVLEVPPGITPTPTPAPGSIYGEVFTEGTATPSGEARGVIPEELPGAGVGVFKMAFLDSAVELLCSLVQSRHHRKPGPVCDLVTCVEDLTERGGLDVVPPSFWTTAGITAAGGFGIRTPSDQDIQRWRCAE